LLVTRRKTPLSGLFILNKKRSFYSMYILRHVAFLICYLCCLNAYAQSTNKVWAFGWGAGLDFNTTPPTPFISGIHSLEGVASVSNSAGQLLMYAYGDTIYNRLHQPMPNGWGTLGTPTYGSCTQGALIVPRPGSSTQYFVFALEGLSDGIYTGRLFYNLVDMTLNGGLGDVVASEKLILVDSLLGEKLTAVAGPCGNIWVLAIPFSGEEIRAYEVTASGVNTTPVISALPAQLYPGTYDACVLKASHNGEKLVAGNFRNNDYDVFDFDNTTGLASGPVLILPNPTLYMPYGACFSPDDSKLYVFFDSIYQYNMSLSTNAAILNSRMSLHYIVLAGKVAGDMQLGPDGKIYMATENRAFLSTIEYPNLPGTACSFMPMSVTLPAPSWSVLGLPNVIVNAVTTGMSNVTDTVVCNNFTAKSSSAVGPYVWNTGDTTLILNIVSPGTYWVTATTSACGTITDTFKVSFWEKHIRISDTFGCRGAPLHIPISVTIASGESARWSTGDAVANIIIKDTGVYWVEVNKNHCVSSDTFRITYRSCDCKLILPNAFSPNNDGLNDRFRPLFAADDCAQLKYLLQVYNRWGQVVYRGYESGQGWDGFYSGAVADVGVYFYSVQIVDAKGKRTLKGDIALLR
jgi:gliding motility-associated-like protein